MGQLAPKPPWTMDQAMFQWMVGDQGCLSFPRECMKNWVLFVNVGLHIYLVILRKNVGQRPSASVGFWKMPTGRDDVGGRGYVFCMSAKLARGGEKMQNPHTIFTLILFSCCRVPQPCTNSPPTLLKPLFPVFGTTNSKAILLYIPYQPLSY